MKPKLLAFDLECSSLTADFGIILCCGFQTVGTGKTEVISLLDYAEKDPIKAEKLLLKDISKRLLEADCWIAHFGKYFDCVFVNTRLLYHRLPTLPTNFPLIDTWRTSKNQLKLRSNRLVTIQDFLNLKSSKTSIKPEQWIRALAGDKKSFQYIIDHCEKDIDVLVETYELLKPLIVEHPTMLKLDGRGGCRYCGKEKLQKRGYHRTKMRIYQRYQCQACHSWQKGTKPLKVADIT